MINPSTLIINHFSILVEFDGNMPESLSEIEKISEEIISRLNLTVVNHLHHCFTPQGITIVFLLSQSHLAIHTWPEYKKMHLDLLSCSSTTENNLQIAIKESLRLFKLKSVILEKLAKSA